MSNAIPALTVVLECLVRAEASFARDLGLAAREALERLPARIANAEFMASYERYVPSHEVTTIARFLFMIEAYGLRSNAAFAALIEQHNAHMEIQATKVDYLRQWGLKRSRLAEAVFKPAAVKNAMLHLDEGAAAGRTAMDGATIARFLVEFVSKTQVYEALEVLTQLGFFNRQSEGNFFGSKVYVSIGRLETLYGDYLTHVSAWRST